MNSLIYRDYQNKFHDDVLFWRNSFIEWRAENKNNWKSLINSRIFIDAFNNLPIAIRTSKLGIPKANE